MTLQLDDRRRAMLMEMNVKVWTDPRVVSPPVQRAIPVPATGGTPAAVPVAVPVAAPVRPLQVASPVLSRQPVPAGNGNTPAGVGTMDWPLLEAAVTGCQACSLCASRKNAVFGAGSRQADWLIVGEAPNENEDLSAQPFAAQEGKLLDNMLRAVGLARDADANGGVFLTNVVKCRPPANRSPLPEELARCDVYLRRQVELLQPRVILAMGRFATQSLLQSTEPIGKLRGRVHAYHGVPVVVTYHPAYLLRSLAEKSRAWADLCLAMDVVRQHA